TKTGVWKPLSKETFDSIEKEGFTSKPEYTSNSKTFRHKGETYRVKYTPYLYMKLTKTGVWEPLSKETFDSIEKERATSKVKEEPVVPNEIVKPTSKAFVPILNWDKTKTYAAKCIVLYNGIQYQSTCETNKEPVQSNDWKVLTKMEVLD
ncbi:hypothetical protein CN553_23440, partial [Bacillus cereus]